MAFKDEVKQAFEAAQNAAVQGRGAEYVAMLHEFAAGLSALGIGADIVVPGPGLEDPRRYSLRLYPLYRPARGSLMLLFFVEGDTIKIFGQTTETLRSRDELKEWLLRFVKLPAFVESVEVLRKQSALPVEARVRVNEHLPYAKDDVMVTVPAADQEKLAKLAQDAEVELDVTRIEFPGNARFAEPADKYKLLDSAGISVRIVRASVEGAETLKIKGSRA